MIICHDMIVKIILMADFKRKVLAWDNLEVPIKEKGNFIGKMKLPKQEMRQVVMQNIEPALTRKYISRVVKILTVPIPRQA